MIAKWFVASAVFAIGVFLAAVVTVAVLNIRRNGIDLRAVFAARRFANFLAAATVWSLAGLLYIVQASGLTVAGLAGLHGIVVLTGWAATLALWLLAHRLLATR